MELRNIELWPDAVPEPGSRVREWEAMNGWPDLADSVANEGV